MGPQFCYGREGVQFGPYSATQMRSLAAAGEIVGTDEVWQEGSDRKLPASRVGNLFAASAVVLLDASAGSVEPAAAGVEAGESVYVDDAPLREALPKTQRPPEPARKKRIIAMKGGQLMGQDGVSANYRKKCGTCGWEDSCRSTVTIRTGTTRITYFCRKCRKARTVEMQGITS